MRFLNTTGVDMNTTKTLAAAALLAVGLNAPSAFADAQLAASKACMACHAVDMKLVGPAFKDVAAKYKDQDGAQEALVAKLKAGGSGAWGNIPMPPQGHVKDDDLNTLVTWILGF